MYLMALVLINFNLIRFLTCLFSVPTKSRAPKLARTFRTTCIVCTLTKWPVAEQTVGHTGSKVVANFFLLGDGFGSQENFSCFVAKGQVAKPV